MTPKALWIEWSARFAALQPREKYLVIGAALFVVLFGGYSFWVEPAQLKKARLEKAIAQQQAEQTQLAAQLAALSARKSDPDAANRAAIEKLQKQLADTEGDIRGFDSALVAPEQMPALLQALLARHRSLALLGFATLPPQALIPSPEPKADDKKGEPVPDAMPGGNIYKHGIEIKISGGYLDLLDYLAELEGGERRLLLSSAKLSSAYPVSELTLTVYTLSLERAWLQV